MQPKMVATESFKADRSSIFDLPSFPPPGVTRRGRLVCDASHTLAKRRISTSPSDPHAKRARGSPRRLAQIACPIAQRRCASRAVRLGAVVRSRLDARRFVVEKESVSVRCFHNRNVCSEACDPDGKVPLDYLKAALRRSLSRPRGAIRRPRWPIDSCDRQRSQGRRSRAASSPRSKAREPDCRSARTRR